VALSTHIRHEKKKHVEAPPVALIPANGPIETGKHDSAPLLPTPSKRKDAPIELEKSPIVGRHLNRGSESNQPEIWVE
jgi:hypothetical protein